MSSLFPDSGVLRALWITERDPSLQVPRDLLMEPFPRRVLWDGVLNQAGKRLSIQLGSTTALLHPGNFLSCARVQALLFLNRKQSGVVLLVSTRGSPGASGSCMRELGSFSDWS